MSRRRPKDISERIYQVTDLTDEDLARSAAMLIEQQLARKRGHTETRLMMTILMQEVERRVMLLPVNPSKSDKEVAALSRKLQDELDKQ